MRLVESSSYNITLHHPTVECLRRSAYSSPDNTGENNVEKYRCGQLITKHVLKCPTIVGNRSGLEEPAGGEHLLLRQAIAWFGRILVRHHGADPPCPACRSVGQSTPVRQQFRRGLAEAPVNARL